MSILSITRLPILVLLLIATVSARAESTVASNELQERCRQSALQFVNEKSGGEGLHSFPAYDANHHPLDKEVVDSVSFRSHYNMKLNQCFALVTNNRTAPPELDPIALPTSNGIVLWNLSEGTYIGVFVSLQHETSTWKNTCVFENATCASAAEFDARVARFMTD